MHKTGEWMNKDRNAGDGDGRAMSQKSASRHSRTAAEIARRGKEEYDIIDHL